MDEDDWPTYRFRWSNIDLERFREQRREAAMALRREAAQLIDRADVIDKEAWEWFHALQNADDSNA